MITLQAIRKSYQGRIVLDVPVFTFHKNERYALIGANGSGKSTLLRILAGTLTPDSGSVTYADGLPQALAYLPQQPYAYGFSVLRNVTMAIKQANAPQLARAALAQVELSDFCRQSGSKLSGGETQRMALARMIAVPRTLLILDEPTSATDIAGTDCVEQVLHEYCTEHQASLIFATHSLAQAHRLATQVVMLDHGCIVEAGPVETVLHNPQSEQTQAFLRHWQWA